MECFSGWMWFRWAVIALILLPPSWSHGQCCCGGTGTTAVSYFLPCVWFGVVMAMTVVGSILLSDVTCIDPFSIVHYILWAHRLTAVRRVRTQCMRLAEIPGKGFFLSLALLMTTSPSTDSETLSRPDVMLYHEPRPLSHWGGWSVILTKPHPTPKLKLIGALYPENGNSRPSQNQSNTMTLTESMHLQVAQNNSTRADDQGRKHTI